MDEDQHLAFNLAISGHNLLITGQAGTGKTYLVKKIINYLRNEKNKNVSIACSTGIAATQYSSYGGQTLHKWSGIQDGRWSNEEILHLVRTDDKFSTAKSNIENVDMLIIDEVSMISSKVLNQVQLLMKNVRNSSELFGGVQIILVGDFYQLPPVPNKLYGDPGNICFKVPWFENNFPHKINFNIVHRQDEQALVNCVNELETGELSDDSTGYLLSLNRPLPVDVEESSIHLFARNIDVDLFNYEKLEKLPGEMTVYSSTDEGSPYYLNQIIAPKNIGLKVGCQVILLKNLNNFLVNGLRGTVSKLFEQSAEIKFPVTDKILTVNIVPTTFTVYDPVSKIEVAKRLQLPIKLAYAITIHKSQGMTIENLVVHCQHINQPGQLGVAVGRAVSTDGLKIVNFNKNYCKMHPNYVSEFYKSFSVGEIKDDLSCCKQTFSIDTCLKESESDNSSNLSDYYCDDSDFSDFELDEMNNSAVEDETLMSKDALKSVLLQFEDTPAEDQINKFQSKIFAQYRFYDDWFHEQFSIMEDISLNTFLEGEDGFSQKQKNEFFVKFNTYITSNEFKNTAIELLKAYKQENQETSFRVLISLMFYLERYFIQQLSDYIPLQPAPSLFSLNCDLDPAGKGKIRYVSGYVVAKLKYNLSKKIRNSLFVKGKETDIKIYKCQMEIFNSLCCSYNDLLQDCDDPGSLEEIKRKQNQNESLCNITNEAFAFFQNLEHKCRTKLTHQNLVNFRKHLFKNAKEGLINDSELYQSWISCVVSSKKSSETENSQDDIGELLQSLVTNCENYLTLFEFVVTLFLKVCLSQFRRDYLTFLKKEKGKALRKKVIEKTKKTEKCFNMKSFIEDKSDKKLVSFLRLKAELLENKQFFEKNSFSLKDLLSICNDFKIKFRNRKKEEIVNAIVNHFLNVDTENLPNTELLVTSSQCEPHASTSYSEPGLVQPENVTTKLCKSNIKRKGKAKGRGKGKAKKIKKTNDEETDENNCGICCKTYITNEEWISCDQCFLWYHRDCVNIEDNEWIKYSNDEEPYTCPMCF